MKSTVIVFFLKIRKGNTSICVNSYNKLHILPAKLKNIEFHSAANIPIIFLCMRFTFYAVQLFVIYCLIIIFFVCRFLPRFSCRGFSLRGKACRQYPIPDEDTSDIFTLEKTNFYLRFAIRFSVFLKFYL